MIIFKNLAEIKASEGKFLGTTEWRVITQKMIDDFANATLDFQWIHVDAERAEQTPVGSTIAHGFLTLSLAAKFLEELLNIVSVKMAINYGLNKVRFINVVPVNARLQMSATIKSVEDFADNGVKITIDAVIHIEGQTKPACVLEWIVVQFE